MARMTREERDRGVDALGEEAKEYYLKAMEEAREMIEVERRFRRKQRKIRRSFRGFWRCR